MRKLKLEIEELVVDSFATDTAESRFTGTVRARADYGADAEPVEEEPAPEPATATCTCPQVTYCASCVNTCDACTHSTCHSGAPVCCA